MSRELLTESPIGTYDRNKLFLVTFPDATQKFFPRAAKSSHGQISSLSWWKKCGIFTDERDQWSKSVMHPEHVQIMKRAGISADDLFNTLLSPSHVEDVLAWFNIYRIVFGRTPETLHEFTDFVQNVESCTGARTKNPVTLGKYVAKFQSRRISYNAFLFALGNEAWTDAISTHLDAVPDNTYVAPTVRTLMQIGASPDAVVLADPRGVPSGKYGMSSNEAIISMFTAGEFASSEDCYETTRLLAEMLYGAPQSADCITDLFFAPGTDRQRLRNVVLEDKITDGLRLTAIFTEEVPTAIVGGFL
jgi:hypothetical protein